MLLYILILSFSAQKTKFLLKIQEKYDREAGSMTYLDLYFAHFLKGANQRSAGSDKVVSSSAVSSRLLFFFLVLQFTCRQPGKSHHVFLYLLQPWCK
jgi:hypothetical protein